MVHGYSCCCQLAVRIVWPLTTCQLTRVLACLKLCHADIASTYVTHALHQHMSRMHCIIIAQAAARQSNGSCAS
jgi:hypothetical protein